MHYAFKVTCPTLVILQQYPFILLPLLPLLLQLLLLLPALECSTTSEGTVVFSHIISNLGSDQSWSSRTSGRSQDPKGRSYALLPVWLWKYSTEENMFTCVKLSGGGDGMGVVYSGLHQSDLVRPCLIHQWPASRSISSNRIGLKQGERPLYPEPVCYQTSDITILLTISCNYNAVESYYCTAVFSHVNTTVVLMILLWYCSVQSRFKLYFTVLWVKYTILLSFYNGRTFSQYHYTAVFIHLYIYIYI